MIDKATFEALVRAEAENAVPVVRLKHPTLKHHSFDLSEGARKLYIATRMEHEWKLVEALGKLQRMGLRTSIVSAHVFYKKHNLKQTADSVKNELIPAWAELLSPYTTKGIER